MSSKFHLTMTSKALSVLQKESFFDDSFFSDSWQDFDKAVQQVLDKFDTQGLKVNSDSRVTCNDLYRKIRSNKIDEDLYMSQALQVTEKEGKFQCVMDVKDFNPANLQVKVVDDKVVVEGKYEKKSEDGSSMSSKAFYKEFTLPKAADFDQVSTALSKDGVLTIKAAKKEGSDAVVPSADGTVKSSSSSVEQSSSVVKDGSSSSSSSSTVQKSSFQSSSSSSFASSSSSSMSSSSKVSNSFSSSSSGVSSSNMSALDSKMDSNLEDMAKDMKDRLVFSHESVNLKLPENK